MTSQPHCVFLVSCAAKNRINKHLRQKKQPLEVLSSTFVLSLRFRFSFLHLTAELYVHKCENVPTNEEKILEQSVALTSNKRLSR